MPELRRFALSRRSDLLLAVIVVGWVLVYLSLIAGTEGRRWMVLVFALPYAAALGVRRRWPVPATAVACAALAAVWPLGLAPVQRRAGHPVLPDALPVRLLAGR